jgi:hypothetical protein
VKHGAPDEWRCYQRVDTYHLIPDHNQRESSLLPKLLQLRVTSVHKLSEIFTVTELQGVCRRTAALLDPQQITAKLSACVKTEVTEF